MTESIDHDAIFKELLTVFFVDFLELFLPEVLKYTDVSEIEWEAQETIREVFSPITQGKRKLADVIAKVRFKGKPTQFLIHIESESDAYKDENFPKRIFNYFSRLQEKFDLPVYPIALFSFDKPFKEQENRYVVSFPDRQVLDFSFVAIQLNRLNWRDFLKKKNPVALALMTKMGVKPEERLRVKAESLRLLTTLKIDSDKMSFILNFIATYLPTKKEEEAELEELLNEMGLETKEKVMRYLGGEFKVAFEEAKEKFKQEFKQEGKLESKLEDIVRILNAKFEEIPEEFRDVIEGIENLEALEQFVVEAATTESFESFKVFVEQYLNENQVEELAN